MTGQGRDRIAIDLSGAWRLYAHILPAGSRALGTVTRDIGDTGALILTPAGRYVQCNAGVLRNLPQAKVAAALAEARTGTGGPGRGQGAKTADGVSNVARYNITLDADSDAAARKLGDGDRSLGIRRALATTR